MQPITIHYVHCSQVATDVRLWLRNEVFKPVVYLYYFIVIAYGLYHFISFYCRCLHWKLEGEGE